MERQTSALCALQEAECKWQLAVHSHDAAVLPVQVIKAASP